LILDSSAIVAVLLEEPGYERLLEALSRARSVGVGTATLAETGIVLRVRVGPEAGTLLARFLQEIGAVEVPFGERHWRAAVDAFARYGKGRHPAGLNFGDCLTYATAKLSESPLLFVGEDFAQTDLESA
jgi:ribonuclease VapC